MKVLDTNILIDLSRDDEKILTYLEKVEKEEICYILLLQNWNYCKDAEIEKN